MRSSHIESPAPVAALAWTRADYVHIAIILTTTILAIARFWQRGVSSEADMLIGIYRVFELDQAWRQGIMFPRLGPNINFTYGGPLFQFYAPLASYGALVFHWVGLGFIEATKAVFTLNLVLAGVGAYLFARWLFSSRLAGLVSGMLYLLAPYLLVVVYERGALAESLALGLVPWVFWAFHRLLVEDNDGKIIVSAGLVALIMLAHNVTTLYVLPTVALYCVLLAWWQGRWRQLLWVGAAMGLGLGMSAFYWVPALLETKYVSVANMFGENTDVINNLVSAKELVQPNLIFDYWGAMHFHFAFWQALLVGISLVAILVQPRRFRFNVAVFGLILLLVLAVQLDVSASFWEHAPLVRYLQFPWRMLGLASFCTAMIVGSIFAVLPGSTIRVTALAGVLLIGVAVLSLARLDPKYSTIWYPIDSSQIGKPDLFERGRIGYPLFSDFSPIDLTLLNGEIASSRPITEAVLPPLAVLPTVRVMSERSTELEFQVQTSGPMTLRGQRIFFPGWQVYVDGEPVRTYPSGAMGLVTAEVPPGNHVVSMRFQDTLIRRGALWVSGVSFLLVLVLAFRRSRKRRLLVGMLLVAFVLGILFWRFQTSRDVRSPVPYTVDFQDGLHLVGYDLPKVDWKPGETIELRLYWLAEKTPDTDYAVFLHLTPLDDSGKVAQHDGSPILGYGPTTRWEPGEVIVDEQQLHLDKTIPPGRYRLLFGLYKPDTLENLRVQEAPLVLPGDRVVLTEIEVSNE